MIQCHVHSIDFPQHLLQMLSSGLPELSTTEDIQYVSDALLPGKSEPEATFTFTKYVYLAVHNYDCITYCACITSLLGQSQ